jgi:regulator of replication initiation timing
MVLDEAVHVDVEYAALRSQSEECLECLIVVAKVKRSFYGVILA